jgi:hypothetical protein
MGYHHRRTISMSDEETRMQSLPGDRAMRRSGAMVLHAVVLLASTLVQVSHILVAFRERDGRSFLTGRLLAV